MLPCDLFLAIHSAESILCPPLEKHIWRHLMPICPSLVMVILITWPNFSMVVQFLRSIVPEYFLPCLQLISSLRGDTLRPCKYPAPRQNVPLDLSVINDWSSLFQGGGKRWFVNSSIHSTLPVDSQNFTVSRVLPSPHVCLCIDYWDRLLKSDFEGFIIQYLIILVLSLRFGHREPFQIGAHVS